MPIDWQFSEQELLVRQTARQFVDERVAPLVRDCFRDGRFPSELIPELGRLGFLGANLEGYGCAGMNGVEYGLVMQEIERGDSGLRSFVRVQSALIRSWPSAATNRSRYLYGTYSLAIRDPKGGAPVNETGKLVEIWKKQADGKWKCIVDTYNSDLTAASESKK